MGDLATLFAQPGADAPPERPGERLHVFHPAHLPGTEWFAATDSARMWRVYHEQYTFCVLPTEANVREAGALYSYRRGEVRCRPHAAYFYEPDTLHANRVIFHPAAFYVIRVDTALVIELAGELGLGLRPHFRLAESSAPPLLAAFDRLVRALAEPDPLLQETRLVEVVRAVLGEVAEARPVDAAVSRPAAERARAYLEAHVTERVTLEDLARVSGLSRYHLVRTFRKAYGVAPHAFQSALRVARAGHLLRRGLAPAAIDVGFFDQSHLTRHFVRAYGVTPAAYQRLVAVA